MWHVPCSLCVGNIPEVGKEEGWKQGDLFWETVAAVQEGHVGALDKGDNEGLGEKWPGSKYVPAGTREPADGLVIDGERTRGW